ncbi:MAG: FAD-binding oxidoreductase, partial [Gammaproteobacteria bacterium]|nr:FAD-binding oxidoreductase [Gammaproteobacteria bacterium]
MSITLDQLPDRLPGTAFRTREEFADRHPGFHPENLSADLMALPGTTAEVSALLALCHRGGIPVVTQGGRTGLSGGATTTPGQLIVDTYRMNRIESIDPLGGTAIVQCGVTLAALESAAGEHGLTAGIDLSARDSATLGGMAATNAGGIEAFRNGVMRHRILGLEAVLPDGSVYSHLRRVTKANEGPDIGQLFIGSEGTLGVITRLSLSLLPSDPPGVTALAVFPDAARAVSGFAALRDHPDVQLLSAEAMWPDYVIAVAGGLSVNLPVEVRPGSEQLPVLLEAAAESWDRTDSFEGALMALYESGAMADVVIAKSERERGELWRIREDSF